MERKFTKGPWFYEEGVFNCPNDHCSEQLGTIVSREEWNVAAIEFINDTESKANAHLISAAPELLKELESHCKDCMDRNKWDNKCSGCLTQRAIAKAYGEPK